MQNQWYIARDGKQYGPVSDGDIVQLIQNRELFDGDYLWRQGFDNWLPAAQIPELAELVHRGSGVREPVVNQPIQKSEIDNLKPPGPLDEPLQHAVGEADTGVMFDQAAAHASQAEKSFEQEHGQIADSLRQEQEAIKNPGSELYNASQYETVVDSPMTDPMNTSADFSQTIETRDAPMVFQGATPSEMAQSRDFQTQQFASSPELTGVDHTHGRNNARSGSKFSWPVWVAIGAGVVFVLLLGSALMLPFIIPPETIKTQISTLLKEKTGRDVSLKGKLSYRFFPSFGLDLNQIVIHNPSHIKGPDFLTLARLQADLKLLPLLQKRIEVERIILHRAELSLITDNRGKTNYEFKTADAAKFYNLKKSIQIAQAGTVDTSDIIARTLEKLEQEEQNKKQNEKQQVVDPSGPDTRKTPQSSSDELKVAHDILVGEIKIINGAVKLIDQSVNRETNINAINLTLNAPAHEKAVTAKGVFRYLENRISLNAELATLREMLNGDTTKTTIAMNSDLFEGHFQGKLKLHKGVEFAGITDVQTYSLQKVLNWLGTDVPKKGYGASYIRGKMDGDLKLFTLRDAKIKIDQSMLLGSVNVRSQGTRPRITAQLKTNKIDFSPYLKQKSEIRKGYLEPSSQTSIAAWNSSKIDLSFLNLIDGALLLKADKLVVNEHMLEKSDIAVKVNAGHMTLSIPNFEIYEGKGALNLIVNAAKVRPSIKSVLNLQNVQMKPLLVNSAGFDWVSGKGNLKLEVASAGNTESQMISLLNGNGKLSVADGAIEGVNIPAALRGLKKGKLPDSSKSNQEKTDFSSLVASFTIDKGIVYNKDLLLKSPLLRVVGEGQVNLPQEQIDYGFRPKVVGNLAGQGGETDILGINIPIRLVGPLAKPKIIPDAKALVGNQGQAIKETVKTVETIAKKIKKKKISSEEMKNLLEGMIDGNNEDGNILENILQ